MADVELIALCIAARRRTVYNQYIWAAGALGVGSKWKATVSPMELTYLPTGQKIMFFGLDDPGNLKSIKLPFGYVAYVRRLD